MFFSPDFDESILEASDNGELRGIENIDLTRLEKQFIISNDYIYKIIFQLVQILLKGYYTKKFEIFSIFTTFRLTKLG
tara:strand:- start:442 stop:675 length:234 start_codon:yes stop_codon:yes gene_type:complete